MLRNERRFYFLLVFACFVGYSWIYMHISTVFSKHVGSICVLKKISNLPCPSCGSTRAILALLKGDWIQSMSWNPLGLFLLGGLVIIPSWVCFDVFFKSNSFFKTYLEFEQRLKNKWIMILLILLIAVNWIWNIYKGL